MLFLWCHLRYPIHRILSEISLNFGMRAHLCADLKLMHNYEKCRQREVRVKNENSKHFCRFKQQNNTSKLSHGRPNLNSLHQPIIRLHGKSLTLSAKGTDATIACTKCQCEWGAVYQLALQPAGGEGAGVRAGLRVSWDDPGRLCHSVPFFGFHKKECYKVGVTWYRSYL